MSYLFNAFLYHPILNSLVFFYNTIAFKDLGIAIILTTILVRCVLFPVYQKVIKQQVLTAKVAPEVARIQKDHKEDKERQTKEILELYKKNKVNPFYIIFAIIVQIPVFLAVWKVITTGTSSAMGEGLYSFITNPGTLNHMFLGIVNLSDKNLIFVIAAALIQFFQSKMASASTPKPAEGAPKNPFSGNQLSVMMSIMTLVILWNLPAAVAIYWITTTLFSVVQQWIVNISIKNEELKGNN